MTPELEKRRVRLQELIRVRKFCYRMRLLMLWLLALGCWLVPWYTAIPMIACAAMTATWAWHDTRVHRHLVHQLSECHTEMSWMGVYR